MAELPQNPAAPPESFTLSKFSGIKNTVTSERLTAEELETAINVDIDDSGQIHRRRGYKKVSSGNFHSLFQSSRKVYGVKDDNLGIINDDYSFTVLKSGIGWNKLSYVEVDNNVYFSSLTASGVIKNDVVQPWGQVDSAGYWYSPVVKPTATLNPIAGTFIHSPPMAQVLGYWNGRIYLAQGRDLWCTELYLYDSVDRTSNYLQFESDITLIGTVTDGFYVGTTTEVWFLSGVFSQGLKRIPVIRYGAMPGSLLSVPAELVGVENSSSKNAVLFMTDSGLFAGMDNGMCYNLTQNRVLFPDAVTVAALFRRQDGVNQYVGVLDSQGSPSSNARIGDYVDVEIKRFRGA